MFWQVDSSLKGKRKKKSIFRLQSQGKYSKECYPESSCTSTIYDNLRTTWRDYHHYSCTCAMRCPCHLLSCWLRFEPLDTMGVFIQSPTKFLTFFYPAFVLVTFCGIMCFTCVSVAKIYTVLRVPLAKNLDAVVKVKQCTIWYFQFPTLPIVFPVLTRGCTASITLDIKLFTWRIAFSQFYL